ncbi:type III restriction enzyme [Ruminiclostridium sufflavum DSM 19573]|uniref:Type III restriction enzyme n=1 Tax=Ruminiclostridium sufflavum DSM 19573 TaxID=1121337 RepID=A0A318XL97_9FIRM|nr:type III restriction endonuclease subunit R [Ruminiclostridium sufflavum]PYG87243.1 type III restriction enzyme [Ruminiclostridium sufflavum DSM 19573]
MPSIAVKEGVYKSLTITGEHFKKLYGNMIYNYFVYDSSKLEQVLYFASSQNIEIMIINIDAFRKGFKDTLKESKANIIHRANDKLNGMKPIELIGEARPFVIIDEPQSVDTTPKAKEAIRYLNPACILRYSATHAEKHNLVYKLNAADSYALGLVKQIEVAGFETKACHNNAYMKLISVDNKKMPVTAEVELDIKNKKGVVKRKEISVKCGDDLYKKSGGRDVYQGFIINEIYCGTGAEYLSFTGKGLALRIGDANGDIADIIIKEQQIRKTIEEHLDREMVLNKLGIKVLSLFFIDRVVNYRYYDELGKPKKGIYARLFEKNYIELIRLPKYHPLLGRQEADILAGEVHSGYFSADKRGRPKDTSGTAAADEDAYTLIMKDKEKLISFDTKLSFIFSHSALREGWDNPNVFQICTLNQTRSEIKKRQEIGRGLRLCVNQQGERQHGLDINTLTVMANESYEQFAEALQREYEEDEGIRFGIIEKHSFADIPAEGAGRAYGYLGQAASEKIFNHFIQAGYIDSTGKIQDKLKAAVRNNALSIPPELEGIKSGITAIAKKVSGRLNIKNNSEKGKNVFDGREYLDKEFKKLWDKIKYRTTYSLDFDSERLINECSEEMEQLLSAGLSGLVYAKAALNINSGGVAASEEEQCAVTIDRAGEYIPDIIAYLQKETNLTRKTIVEILIKSKTIPLFKKNPQGYMEQVARIISSKMRLLLADGIKYSEAGDGEYYLQELYEISELAGYLKRNMPVRLYAKLPGWFRVQTPLGACKPDWAVLIETNGRDKLYFVPDTKGNISYEMFRTIEN